MLEIARLDFHHYTVVVAPESAQGGAEETPGQSFGRLAVETREEILDATEWICENVSQLSLRPPPLPLQPSPVLCAPSAPAPALLRPPALLQRSKLTIFIPPRQPVATDLLEQLPARRVSTRLGGEALDCRLALLSSLVASLALLARVGGHVGRCSSGGADRAELRRYGLVTKLREEASGRRER